MKYPKRKAIGKAKVIVLENAHITTNTPKRTSVNNKAGPARLKPPVQDVVNAPAKAPKPTAENKYPSPVSPVPYTSFAKAGIININPPNTRALTAVNIKFKRNIMLPRKTLTTSLKSSTMPL